MTPVQGTDFHAKPPYITDGNQQSLYGRRYWSSGKGRFYCPEDLGRFHLCEAYNRLKRHLAGDERRKGLDPPDGSQADAAVLECLGREIKRRGLDPDWKGGYPPGDERLEGREAVAYRHPPDRR